MLSFLGRGNKTVTDADVKRLYQNAPSLADWLPWIDYCDESQTFTLEDGFSAGAMFELVGVSTEARSDKFLAELHENIHTCLNHTIPHKDDPFVLQFFVQDASSLSSFQKDFDRYATQRQSASPLAEHFMQEMQAHLTRVSQEKGFFVDNAVSGSTWSGRFRRVRIFLYRRIPQKKRSVDNFHLNPVRELNEVALNFVAQLRACGMSIRRCSDKDLFEFMFPWFNPGAAIDNDSMEALMDQCFAAKDAQPFGFDFTQSLFVSHVRSCQKLGYWVFDQRPHRAVAIDALRRKPVVGHLTGERKVGDNIFAVFDKLPSGSILSVSVVIQPQDHVENKVIQILNASKGETAEAQTTERDATQALTLMASGDYLYPTVMTLYLRADEEATLQRHVNDACALLLANGLHPIREQDELLALNTYIRQLPMNYEPARDKVERKSRLMFSSDLAKLLPFYGRSRGTGHPGMVFFNRGAEPLVFDPLNKLDRSKNAFGLVLGPPGSGKSSLMVYLLLLILSIYKARVYIIEKGGSFKLLGDYCRHFGLTVNHVSLHPRHNVSLPPFSDALRMLEVEEKKAERNAGHEEGEVDPVNDLESDPSDEERDYLGEMELKARVMITGGDSKEEALMTRADRLTIRRAIVNAARKKREEVAQRPSNAPNNQSQVLTEDVVSALAALALDESATAKRRERAQDMADAMALYCSGTAGQFFNRPGEEWPEADVTIFEMGLLANEGYEDQLALGFMGLMNQINGVVEREQYSERPTFVLGDEAHLITTNPLLALFLVKIVKMWRKLGAWLWLATQNMEDFPDSAKKLLGMFEWWFAMVCPKEQIDQIARFKDLTPEQKSLLLAARKEPGKYTEGVVLADKVQALFRNVPPPLALALSMTEKHEKQERAALMRELNISELEAVFKLRDQMVNTFMEDALRM